MEKNAKLASFKLMDLDEEKMEKLQMILWQNPFGMFRVEADKENVGQFYLLIKLNNFNFIFAFSK